MTYRRCLLSLFLCAACLLCGCGSQKQSSQNDAPYFMLDSLPDIGEYVDDIVYDRMYPEYRESIKPGQNYGQLVPYVGAFRDYHMVNMDGQWSDFTTTVSKYGIMTADGQIVTDAVFDWVNVTEFTGGEYILEFYQGDSDGYGAEKMLFCNSDGSWVMEGDAGLSFNFASWQEGFIICTDYSQVDYQRADRGPSVSVFDRQGNKLYSLSNCEVLGTEGFCDGYLPVYFFTNYLSYDYEVYFVDTAGRIAFRNVHPNEGFQNGLAPAQSDETGLWGLFTASGNWLIPPKYDAISKDGEYYIATSGSVYAIYNEQGATVASFSANHADEQYLLIIDGHFYWESYTYSSQRVFTNALTGQILRHAETGKPVTGYWYGTNYFYLVDGQNICIVDADGNSVAQVAGSGEPEAINDELFLTREGAWDSEETKVTVYSFSDFKKLWSVTENAPNTNVSYWVNGKYLLRDTYCTAEDFYGDTRIDILNPNTGKAILRNLTNVHIYDRADASYVYCSDGIYTYTYGPKLHLLMKVRNTNTD